MILLLSGCPPCAGVPVCRGGQTLSMAASPTQGAIQALRRQPAQQHSKQRLAAADTWWRSCAMPAATEAFSTAADVELPSAAEQAAMDEVASELVAKLNAAYEQMEPDDVSSGLYPLADADAIEVESATAAGIMPRKGGRRQKPRLKEIPADALPKVCLR